MCSDSPDRRFEFRAGNGQCDRLMARVSRNLQAVATNEQRHLHNMSLLKLEVFEREGQFQYLTPGDPI
jgi:hypothetical protein